MLTLVPCVNIRVTSMFTPNWMFML